MLLNLGWGGWLVGWLVCRGVDKRRKRRKIKKLTRPGGVGKKKK